MLQRVGENFNAGYISLPRDRASPYAPRSRGTPGCGCYGVRADVAACSEGVRKATRSAACVRVCPTCCSEMQRETRPGCVCCGVCCACVCCVRVPACATVCMCDGVRNDVRSVRATCALRHAAACECALRSARPSACAACAKRPAHCPADRLAQRTAERCDQHPAAQRRNDRTNAA